MKLRKKNQKKKQGNKQLKNIKQKKQRERFAFLSDKKLQQTHTDTNMRAPILTGSKP